jgi:DNA-binding response OmpR family regulator
VKPLPESVGPLLLYVEDEPLILDLAVTALEDAGFTVEPLGGAAQAMDALESRAGEFKALITDIDLGTEVDGWEIATRARELRPDLPVIYVSGGSSNDWPSKGVPGSVMIVKPYAFAQLVVAVSTALLTDGPHGASS